MLMGGPNPGILIQSGTRSAQPCTSERLEPSCQHACPWSSGAVHVAAAGMADISSIELGPVSRSREKAGRGAPDGALQRKAGAVHVLACQASECCWCSRDAAAQLAHGAIVCQRRAPLGAADAVQALALATEGVEGGPTPLSITAVATGPGLEGEKGQHPKWQDMRHKGWRAMNLRCTCWNHQRVLTLWSAAAAVKGGGPCSTRMR